jgi:hypothetical protein
MSRRNLPPPGGVQALTIARIDGAGRMILRCFRRHRPSTIWHEPTPRHRLKSGRVTAGATRSRLIQVLRHLGFYEARIAARLREERRAARHLEAARLVRLREQRHAALRDEARRVARLRAERLAHSAMTDDQREAERMERQIVSWLTADADGRGGHEP